MYPAQAALYRSHVDEAVRLTFAEWEKQNYIPDFWSYLTDYQSYFTKYLTAQSQSTDAAVAARAIHKLTLSQEVYQAQTLIKNDLTKKKREDKLRAEDEARLKAQPAA